MLYRLLFRGEMMANRPGKPDTERIAILGMLLLALSLLAGCTGSPERLWLRAPGWSRAQRIGATRVGDPPPLTLDENGIIYTLLIGGEDRQFHPRIVALGRQGEALWDRAYKEIAIARPDNPYLLWDGGQLQLFWIDEERLYNAQVDPDSGGLQAGPVLLSGDERVGDYAVARDKAGVIHVWFGGPRRAPGLYFLTLNDLEQAPTLVDSEGIRPSMRFDTAGMLNVVWAHYPPGMGINSLFYAAYPGGKFEPGREYEIAQPKVGTTSILSGPQLGLDSDDVYVFWSVEVRTGMSAGTVKTTYVTFPIGQISSVSKPIEVRVPSTYELPYEAVPAPELKAGPRVLLEASQSGTTGHVAQLIADQNVRDELVIAFRAVLPYLLRNIESQVGTLYFDDGQARSYQLLSFTRGDSTSPFILSDDSGYLYLNWLERGDVEGFLVYFASTAPDLVQALSTLSRDDIGRLTASTLFGMAYGAVLLPFVFILLIAPLLLILLTSFIRTEDETLASGRVLLSIGIALAGYWVAKLAIVPALKDYVPFSAWIPIIPPWLALLLRIGVPLVITVIAAWVAWLFTFRRGRNSPLMFVLLYAITDGVLTMMIYGVTILGGA